MGSSWDDERANAKAKANAKGTALGLALRVRLVPSSLTRTGTAR